MSSEKSILNETLVALSALPKTIVWRNNTGQAWQGSRITPPVGTRITVTHDMIILKNARVIKFGLPGSGDILGTSNGIPLSVEIKTLTGRQAQLQKNFQDRWSACGGKYILARNPEMALSQIETY